MTGSSAPLRWRRTLHLVRIDGPAITSGCGSSDTQPRFDRGAGAADTMQYPIAGHASCVVGREDSDRGHVANAD